MWGWEGTLAVHLVELVGVCPEQRRVPLLVHQQVRVVHLHEFIGVRY